MEQLVNFHTQNGVLEIQFNRADKKNALTNAMYQAVQTAMEQAKSDDNIRVILFTSTGDFFTAGNDLVDFLTKAENDDAKLNALDFVQFLGDYPKPIVAAVTGSGVGIGRYSSTAGRLSSGGNVRSLFRFIGDSFHPCRSNTIRLESSK